MKKNIYNNLNNSTTNPAVFVLASILKYAKDVRMYEKIGKSLIKKYKNDIFHFVGHSSTDNNIQQISDNKTHQNVCFHELFNFNRLSLKRFFTFFTFFFFLLKVKPTTIIIGTFELLLPAVFYKMFYFIFFRKKVKIIYDIQENYFANIKYTKVFFPILRDFLAFYVFLIQKITSFWADFFFLAEYCYQQELTFIGKKYAILPNFILRENFTEKSLEKLKLTEKSTEKLTEKTTNLLFIGTISREYGLYKILSYFDFLTKNEKKNKKTTTQIKLTIFGHCPLAEDFLEIEKISQKNSFISAQISQKPVPYTQIKEKMENSSQENEFENTFVVMPYIINKSYEKRIPTKFYECLAYDLPMIIQKNKYWEDFFEQMQNLIPTHKINVNFIDFDEQILAKTFHQKNTQNIDLICKLPIFWDICEEKINEITFY